MTGRVDCDRAREGISALQDGEDSGLAREILDAHLQACAGCRQWADEAARINRLARLGPAQPGERDLAPIVLAGLPAPAKPRLRPLLRAALLVVAVIQLAIGLVGLLPVVNHQWLPVVHAHLGHETAAFNTAVGAALCWVVANLSRARGPLPLLVVFVAILAGMEIIDLAAGRVDWLRSVSHLPVLAGALLAWALVRSEPRTHPSPGGTTIPAEHPDQHHSGADEPAPASPPDSGAPPPAARHRAA